MVGYRLFNVPFASGGDATACFAAKQFNDMVVIFEPCRSVFNIVGGTG